MPRLFLSLSSVSTIPRVISSFVARRIDRADVRNNSAIISRACDYVGIEYTRKRTNRIEPSLSRTVPGSLLNSSWRDLRAGLFKRALSNRA